MAMTLLSTPKIGSIPAMNAMSNKMPMSNVMNGMSSSKVMANKMPMTKSITTVQCANMLEHK